MSSDPKLCGSSCNEVACIDKDELGFTGFRYVAAHFLEL